MSDYLERPEFMAAQHAMGLICRFILAHDWQKYLNTVRHAETIGPMIDPTTWINSPHQLREKSNEIAAAFVKAAQAYRECESLAHPAEEKSA